MGKYVYRIDKQINFKAINDYTFRAKRWFPDMFPHKTLVVFFYVNYGYV
ncbi:TPA: hypothetical protein ACXNE3_003660 [Proteus mirabilis]